jgi:hypothetical protein
MNHMNSVKDERSLSARGIWITVVSIIQSTRYVGARLGEVIMRLHRKLESCGTSVQGHK